MRIEIPQGAAYIIETLEAAGFEAFIVGGCVRDALLGRIPEDWDITTQASPDQVKALFGRTADTGIKHGTVTVLAADGAYEVTTYRIDGKYNDARHPESVKFTASLKEDLARRDFTINAMAYSDRTGIIDEFGGLSDLDKGIIRCVGSARERLTEDALRIMRAVRFSAQLDFDIEASTREAIRELAPRLSLISSERVHSEMDKLLLSAHPEYVGLMYELGITAVILPEFDRIMDTPQNSKFHYLSVGEHTLLTLKSIKPDRVLRWTMLFHDMGKPFVMTTGEDGIIRFPQHAEAGCTAANAIMRRLKFDNNTRNAVLTLVRYHSFNFEVSRKGIRHAMNKTGTGMFPLLLEVCTADTMGKTDLAKQYYLPGIQQSREYYESILAAGECTDISGLAIDGRDLIGAGIPAGVQIGRILDSCLQAVLDDPGKNNKDELLCLALSLYGEQGTGPA